MLTKVLFLFLFLFQLHAHAISNHASVRPLGFSDDGRYFAVEFIYDSDPTNDYWCDIRIYDTEKKTELPQIRIKVNEFNGNAIYGERKRCFSKIKTQLEKLKIEAGVGVLEEREPGAIDEKNGKYFSLNIDEKKKISDESETEDSVVKADLVLGPPNLKFLDKSTHEQIKKQKLQVERWNIPLQPKHSPPYNSVDIRFVARFPMKNRATDRFVVLVSAFSHVAEWGDDEFFFLTFDR